MLGTHYLIEAYRCNAAKLDDAEFLEQTLEGAAQASNATLLNVAMHKFDPQGVTGFALLAQSHISIHTWPETNYAAIDVYTCGDEAMPELACEFLTTKLESKSHHCSIFKRFSPSELK